MRGFLGYVNTNEAAEGFAAELAGAVQSFKQNSKERGIYMSLAMEIQEYIEKEKDNWAEEVKAQNRREIASAMLGDNMSPEQISRLTGLPVEEVRKLCQEK